MSLASLILGIACAASAAKPFPPAPRDYVHNEGVISAPAEERLGAALAAFEKETGHQFVVALFQDLEGESLERYSNDLFKAWKIGDAKRNDGLLLALFKGNRLWRVEVGYGLEDVVTDLEAGEIARAHGVPRFKQGDFDGGVNGIAAALIERVKTGAAPAPPAGAPSPISDAAAICWIVHVLFMLYIGARCEAYYSAAVRKKAPKVQPRDWAGAGLSLVVLVQERLPWHLLAIAGISSASAWVVGYWLAGEERQLWRINSTRGSRYDGGWLGGSGGWSGGGGGFSGGGGSSGGGGASGGW